ncbi:hypothetical protein [Pedobacter psychroterrae]|uniref:Uncharacterized protein n=1 Tax=Pedobacter psychroterrae TaxID=2530453 RepID=A0A4R0NI48_9SPHI|nr:hypothetical protein [Pedobacter psychroterrae]TCC99898.1 hypothetical protein EZ437_16800 [Pedobacter psychroterrae]
MKYLSTLILALFVSITGAQTIDKPKIEFTTSGIHHINKITLTDTATVVEVKVLFLPNWWSTFSDKAYLENSETGDKYTVKAIEGASFDSRYQFRQEHLCWYPQE